MSPGEKLKKYFGIEINRKLFEDAMDVVQLRIKELNKLEAKRKGKTRRYRINAEY